MNANKNLYQVLGVSEQATEDQIKSAYRKLAKKYHPDAHPGDESYEIKFREINDAYTTLSDADKRKAYDALQGGQQQSQKTTQKANKQETHSPFEPSEADFENIHRSFEQFFGFNPESHEISNEEKLKPKQPNPMDMSRFFESFMGIKR